MRDVIPACIDFEPVRAHLCGRQTSQMEDVMSIATERAVLAGGCFWGMQDLIRRLPGVVSTRVGYSGGDVANATYRNHGNHAEAIEINYDHYNTGEYFQHIDDMLRSILAIWRKLNTLEYIGLRKENIVVKEEVLSKVTKDRKGWNIWTKTPEGLSCKQKRDFRSLFFI